MELNIGTNIKRLRISKGLTQEQLAELLNISAAAVSKWESKGTYPDITMLFPLAEIFGVTVDGLLGHDEAKARADVGKILMEYQHLRYNEGKYAESHDLITNARKKYPHDYEIMNCYMWDLVEGKTTGTYAELLLKNKEEITQICDCILEGCTKDKVRADAINMKAKLLHALGDTNGAYELLSTLSPFQAPMTVEALFEPKTPEFRYWNKWNYYLQMNLMPLKLARTVRYDPELSLAEKSARLESMAEVFFELSEKQDFEAFCIGTEVIHNVLAMMLTEEDAPVEEIIRITEKHFASIDKVSSFAKSESDDILTRLIMKTYKSGDLVPWQVNRLLNSELPSYARLRENPKYMEMLDKWSK